MAEPLGGLDYRITGLSPSHEARGVPHLTLCCAEALSKARGITSPAVDCSCLGVARPRVAPMPGLFWVTFGAGAKQLS